MRRSAEALICMTISLLQNGGPSIGPSAVRRYVVSPTGPSGGSHGPPPVYSRRPTAVSRTRMTQLTPMGLVKILGQVTAIMVIPIVGSALAGLILDRMLGTSPLLALVGL